MEKLKIVFIVNPKSGTKNKEGLPALIDAILDKERFEPTIIFTQYAGHGRELAARLVKEKYEYIIACGGDGTMNEVASELVHTDSVFGIIPYGSGNGLARHLSIPMSPKKALQQINNHTIKLMDYGLAGETKFFCTCGAGFDANISHKFATQGKRGFLTYLKTTVKEYFNYKPCIYVLKNDEIEITQQAFLVTFANASQYGNNAFIAPRASTSDGLLDVCILKPFSLFYVPWLASLLFLRKIDKSKHITIVRAKEITLTRKNAGAFHLDGDPVEKEKEVRVKVVAAGLKVLVGKV